MDITHAPTEASASAPAEATGPSALVRPVPVGWPTLIAAACVVIGSGSIVWHFVGPALTPAGSEPELWRDYLPSMTVHLFALCALLSLRAGYRPRGLRSGLLVFGAVVGVVAVVGASQLGLEFGPAVVVGLLAATGPLYVLTLASDVPNIADLTR